MIEDEARGTGADNDEQTPEEQSPAEKLRDGVPLGAQIPGAQNPESTEIKKELNPNTE